MGLGQLLAMRESRRRISEALLACGPAYQAADRVRAACANELASVSRPRAKEGCVRWRFADDDSTPLIVNLSYCAFVINMSANPSDLIPRCQAIFSTHKLSPAKSGSRWRVVASVGPGYEVAAPSRLPWTALGCGIRQDTENSFLQACTFADRT